MAEHIFLSFSLKPLKEKGRTFENAILPAMEKLAERYSKATLHHGFLSREEVLARNLPTNVIDAIERLFPNTVQYSPIDGEYQKMRGTMASQAKELDNALVIVIGPVVEGVEEEVNAYVKAGMGVHYHLWERPKTKFTVHIDGKVWTEQSVAEELAEIMYEEYNKAVGGKAFNGDPLPSWEDFYPHPDKQKQVNGWIASAKAAMKYYSED